MNQTCSDDLQSHRSQPARSFSDGVYLHTYYGYKQYYYMSNTDAPLTYFLNTCWETESIGSPVDRFLS